MTKACEVKKNKKQKKQSKKKKDQTNKHGHIRQLFWKVMYTFEEGKANSRNRISHNKHLIKRCVFCRKSSASVTLKLFTFQHVYFIG